jgi:hypothetical protein
LTVPPIGGYDEIANKNFFVSPSPATLHEAGDTFLGAGAGRGCCPHLTLPPIKMYIVIEQQLKRVVVLSSYQIRPPQHSRRAAPFLGRALGANIETS